MRWLSAERIPVVIIPVHSIVPVFLDFWSIIGGLELS